MTRLTVGVDPGGTKLRTAIIDSRVVNAFNPCLMILGGGIIKAFPEFIREIEAHVRKHSLAAAVAPLKVVAPALGDAAGVVGSATF